MFGSGHEIAVFAAIRAQQEVEKWESFHPCKRSATSAGTNASSNRETRFRTNAEFQHAEFQQVVRRGCNNNYLTLTLEESQRRLLRLSRRVSELVQKVRMRFVRLHSADRRNTRTAQTNERNTASQPVDANHPVLRRERFFDVRQLDIFIADFCSPHAIKTRWLA